MQHGRIVEDARIPLGAIKSSNLNPFFLSAQACIVYTQRQRVGEFRYCAVLEASIHYNVCVLSVGISDGVPGR